MNQLLIIFAKKPELGKTKTRIAKEYGEEFALKFSVCCIKDLLINISDETNYRAVFITDDSADKEYFTDNYNLDCFALSELGAPKDLNEKFKIAFYYALNCLGFKKVVLIPMDIPYITANDINNAFSALENYNVVLGPENNGGVYLIGLNRLMKNDIFHNVRWSTGMSYQDLVLNSHHMCYSMPTNNDLNQVQDILDNKKIIHENCPRLSKLLVSEGIVNRQ